MKSMSTSRRMRLATGLLLAPMWIAVACADGGGESTPAERGDEPMSPEERLELRRQLQADQVPDPKRLPAEATQAITGEAPQELIDAILADVETQTGADAAALEVVQAEAKRWSSGALGCPEPGQMYTQALVDGYQIVVAYGDDRFDYRANADGYFRLCAGVDSPRL